MNVPLVLLNRRRRGGAAAFTPAGLFALAEPGVWYDPSDVANLAWRRNLLTFTEQFDNAAWTKGNTTVTATSSTAPNATPTADTIAETVDNSSHVVTSVPTFSFTSGVDYTVSLYAKKGSGGSAPDIVQLSLPGAAFGTSQYANFNISTNAVTASSGGTATIVSAGSGWYRLSWTAAATTTATSAISVLILVNNNPTALRAPTYAGSTSSDVLIWGAQLELGSVATDYQRISDVNTEVIERFPSATLYQDTAGTTPVTTPGQTVALALDKSKGLVLGSELVTNGDFSSGTTGWTASAGAAISVVSGRLRIETTVVASPYAYTSVTTVVGRSYRITLNLDAFSGITSTDIFVGTTIGGTNNGVANFSSLGAKTLTFLATATTSFIGLNVKAASAIGQYLEIDNISVKELPGFHATQATLASRPTYGIVPLGGRRNLLTYSEQFDNAVWTKTNSSITANAVSAPDGTTTADKLVENTANSTHIASQAFTTSASTSYTFTVYAKADTRSHLDLSALTGFTTNPIVRFTLSGSGASSVRQGSPTPTHSIQSVGDGWYRCQINVTTVAGGSSTFQVALAVDASSSNFYTGDGTSGLYLWGAQLETGSSASAYQRVGSAFDVTEAGVASLSYLSFDGVDDFLITPTITPGIDRAQVFAGVRKLGDTNACIAEVSTNGTSVNGAFVVQADDVGRYSARSRGTVAASAIATVNTFTPPVTNVLTGLGDISADLATLRVNGTQAAQSTADQGTGNFLAYPLYIGRRGGTTLPFNGQIYSLLVRFGTNLDAGTITSTETWVNSKTGAYT